MLPLVFLLRWRTPSLSAGRCSLLFSLFVAGWTASDEVRWGVHEGGFVWRFLKRGLFLISLHLLQWRGRTGMGLSSGDPGTSRPRPECSTSRYVLSPYMCMDRTMVEFCFCKQIILKHVVIFLKYLTIRSVVSGRLHERNKKQKLTENQSV